MEYPKPTLENTKRFDKEDTSFFVRCVLGEQSGEMPELEMDDLPFLSKIVQSRIDAMKLPIKFSSSALLSVNAFCKNPGQAVVLLADCLRDYEGKTVTTEELSLLYPSGFYTEEVFTTIVDKFMKPKIAHPWASIY